MANYVCTERCIALVGEIRTGIKKLLPKNSFARSVSVLVGGTASSQVLLVLAAPILTRLYSPEDFGLVAVYAGLLGLVVVVASLRYELAIPLPEDDLEAAHIVVLSLLMVLGMTILSSCAVFFFGDFICLKLNVPVLASYLWLLPIGVLLAGTYKVFNYWAIRARNFSSIASTKIRQSLVTLLIQLIAFKAGGVGLLIGQAGGHCVGSLTLAKSAFSNDGFKKIGLAGTRKAAVRYRRFPIFSTWEGFINTAGFQLPPLMFSVFFNTGAAGFYSLSNRVLLLPMSLIGTAVGQVFFSSAAEAHRAGNTASLIVRIYDNLAHIAMPPTVILIMVGPDLFALVFGESWRQAGEFARWMAPWLFSVFVSSPLSTLFSVMEKQIAGLSFQLLLLFSRIGAIGVGAYCNDLILTVILFSNASAMCWVGFLIWTTLSTGAYATAIVKSTLKSLGLTILCTFPLSMNLIWNFGWIYALVLSLFFVLIRYFLMFKKAY